MTSTATRVTWRYPFSKRRKEGRKKKGEREERREEGEKEKEKERESRYPVGIVLHSTGGTPEPRFV